jgi:multiple antibiotic resistance protein
MQLFINDYLKLFFVLTPFFVISMFLTLTQDLDNYAKRRAAIRVTGSVIMISFSLYFFGQYIFTVFGITIDAFRIGAGTLLFLSAVSLVQGTSARQNKNAIDDVTIVPLALPITVGPATTGVLLVMAGEMGSLATIMRSSAALLCAILTVGILLYFSDKLERSLGQRGLVILSKITGLILASLAAQMIFTGAHNFWK